jgi:P-type Cu+ transporter
VKGHGEGSGVRHDVDEQKAAGAATHDGTTYYFCSAGCKEQFVKSPQQYRA